MGPLHAAAQAKVRRGRLLRQLFQLRPGGERQAQSHAHPVHELARRQVRIAHGLYIVAGRLGLYPQYLPGAAGQVQGQEGLLPIEAGRPKGGGDMALLMAGLKEGRAVRRGKGAGQTQACQEHRHIGARHGTGPGGDADRLRRDGADLRGQLLHELRQLLDVAEQGFALAQP